MNCYECRHRRTIPGSHHSRCDHPITKKIHDNPLLSIISIFASVNRAPPITLVSQAPEVLEKLDIKLNEHGVRKGWCNWPVDYDPVWVNQCKGFKEKR